MTAGRVAIVTGGTRGLGAAISEALSADGAHVVAVFAGNEAAAKRFAEEAASRGQSLETVRADIADPVACDALVADAIARHGRVDYLVNNAGVLIESMPAEQSNEEWDRALAVNLSAAFYLCRAVWPTMEEQGFGRIVNVSSISGFKGNAKQAGYAAAKAGLVGLTRSLARAGAEAGITVNCLVPGVFETEMTQGMDKADQERILSLIPVGRRGQPKEFAHAVRFLVGDEAGFMTGSVTTMDGASSIGT